jgi:phosphoribosylformimino-5-aminoimidazole carboxamide ribotide isomerase
MLPPVIDSSTSNERQGLCALDIIPVLDLRGGRVVQAAGGRLRECYPPLHSPWCPDADPFTLIANLLAFVGPGPVYIADLDALLGAPRQTGLIHRIQARWPGLELWIDAGWKDIDSVHAAMQTAAGRWIPVLGSESLDDPAGIESFTPRGFVASLDYRAGRLVGAARLARSESLWPERLILMALDRIGGALGPDFELLRQHLTRGHDRRWYVAGGIRGPEDLTALSAAGAAGALVSSWLHRQPLGPGLLSTNSS